VPTTNAAGTVSCSGKFDHLTTGLTLALRLLRGQAGITVAAQ